MADWSDYKYRAFISYSHADEKWASWLHRSLESYRVPKYLVGGKSRLGPMPARFAPVFRDRDELASSTDLGAELNEALANSACQIVIASPASAKSHWVNEEIKAFKRLGRADRVFCLIVGGEPYASAIPGREDEECFPHALRFQLGEDGEVSDKPAEPIAADARPGKDGKAAAKLKLIAGLLGVGFDALRQRELQRRNRRMAFISAASATGMVIAIGLATTAIIARNEAELQRERAETEAETARRTTSFLVDLFKVSDPGEARGRSITAHEILTAGAASIESELASEPVVQARLMDTIGDVYTNLGLYDDAQELLAKALTKRRDLEEISTEELVTSLLNLADVQTLRSELDDAEALFNEALQRVETATETMETRRADVWAGLAELYFRMGRYEEAQPLLERVLEERRERLGASHPEVADALEELGLNLFDQGNLEDAESYLREALALRRKIFGDEPHPDVAENLNNLANLLLNQERFEESERLYKEALDIALRLYGESHPVVATANVNLGNFYAQTGAFERAESRMVKALDMRIDLLGPEHPDVGLVQTNLAFVYYDQGKLQDAISANGESLRLLEAALGNEHPEVARKASIQARWLAEAGRYNEADALFAEAVAGLRASLPADHPRVALAEMFYADLLTRYPDRLEEAARLATLAAESLPKAYGEDHWLAGLSSNIAGGVFAAQGDREQAELMLTSGYKLMRDHGGASPSYLRGAQERIARFYRNTGQKAAYRAWIESDEQ